LRNSGRRRGPRISSDPITGRASRNTEPHQKYSMSTPPRIGPIALPAEKPEIHTPMAVARCPGSRNMLKIRERVEGAIVAPAMPISARAAMSVSALHANAASSEATLKNAAPISRSWRRPMRSPRVPIVTRDPATRKP
jgi:hypothetical protein